MCRGFIVSTSIRFFFNMKKLFLLVIILLLVDLTYCQIDIVVLHTNDMHARFEEITRTGSTCRAGDTCMAGYSRVAHEVRRIKNVTASENNKEVLFVNAGDTYTGTVWFALYQANITVDFMNALSPDVVVSKHQVVFLKSMLKKYE